MTRKIRYHASPRWREEGQVWARHSSHRRKVDAALALLSSLPEPYSVGSSWGKDSTVLCDLALRAGRDCVVYHMATPYEIPGSDEVSEYFAERMRVVELPPARTLDETIARLREIGLDYERTDIRAGAVEKKRRAALWAAEAGISTQALGLRAEESEVRRMLGAMRGHTYTRADGITVALPLLWWTARDIWAYIADRFLPYHRAVYDAESHGLSRYELRNGGWLTTHGAAHGRFVWLRTHHPQLWERLAAEFPQVRHAS